MSTPPSALNQRLEGPAPVMEVAKDLARRTVLVAPALIVIGAVFWQSAGAASVAYGIAIVVVNFLLAAALLAWGGRISLAMMGAAAMFGFLLRLGLIFLAVLLVKDASWVNMLPLGLTLIVAHLGILFWEMRYVGATLAHPGLKPSAKMSIHHPADPKSSDTTSTDTGSEPSTHETTGAA